MTGNQRVWKLKNKCISGKKGYADEELAVDALIQHQIRNYSSHPGATNIYICEDCGNWHFTSKGKHQLLDDPTVLEMIRREGMAYQWEQKLK